jgi:hypothetical protein
MVNSPDMKVAKFLFFPGISMWWRRWGSVDGEKQPIMIDIGIEFRPYTDYI